MGRFRALGSGCQRCLRGRAILVECSPRWQVRGWAVFEHLDLAVSAAFVAERYWWNALPDGKCVDGPFSSTWIWLSALPSWQSDIGGMLSQMASAWMGRFRALGSGCQRCLRGRAILVE